MSFSSLADFIAMGNHGLYVWLSYGATLTVILANVMAVRVRRRRFLRESRAIERRTRLEQRTHSGVESARAGQVVTKGFDSPGNSLD